MCVDAARYGSHHQQIRAVATFARRDDVFGTSRPHLAGVDQAHVSIELLTDYAGRLYQPFVQRSWLFVCVKRIDGYQDARLRAYFRRSHEPHRTRTLANQLPIGVGEQPSSQSAMTVT